MSIEDEQGRSPYRIWYLEMQKTFNKVYNMWSFIQEVIFGLCLIFTTFAALQPGPPRTLKAAPAKRFFPVTSLVTDFYSGDLGSSFNLVLESEMTFVMYYAPWDAECQRIKWEFQELARYFHDKVTFVAINCWHPAGECKRQFLKIMSYPVMILYAYGLGGVEYRGIKTAAYMSAFLHNAIKPITRIETFVHLKNVLVKHDAVLLGYFNFDGKLYNPVPYRVYFLSALLSLETDPMQQVRFCVVTNSKAARMLGITLDGTIQLHLWNETLIYPRNGTLSRTNLLKWVSNRTELISSWVSPSGRKSSLLSSFVSSSPTLILFTPRHPYLQESSYYYALKELALDYVACPSSRIAGVLSYLVSKERQQLDLKYQLWREDCQEWFEAKVAIGNLVEELEEASCEPNNVTCCTQTIKPKFSQLKYICDLCTPQNKKSFTEQDVLCQTLYQIEEESSMTEQMQKVWISLSHTCKTLMLHYNPFKDVSLSSSTSPSSCCNSQGKKFTETSSNPDDRVDIMIKSRREDRCKTFYQARLYSPFTLIPDGKVNSYNITGLGCHINGSLSFIALDSLRYYEFANNLGVDLGVQKTAAVIFDKQRDEYYIYDSEVTKAGLKKFILDYVEGNSLRFLKSSNPVSSKPEEPEGKTVEIQEITSETFKQVVFNTYNDVVLMYYTAWCGLCLPASTALLNVAHLFDDVSNVTFARIDASKNDLPWQFTVDNYPAVIFFPAYRKENSIAFDDTVTVANLLDFLIANLQPTARLQLLLKTCDTICIQSTRGAILGNIYKLLCKYKILTARLREAENDLYRKYLKMQLNELMYLLRHYKVVHLMLSTNTNPARFGESQAETVLNSFTAYQFNKRKRRSKG